MMKTITKFLATFVAFASLSITACSQEEKPIRFEELPTQAQTFVDAHFSRADVSFVLSERESFGRSYEVGFKSGAKIEFDGSGQWEQVDCLRNPVPRAIVPGQILDYLDAHYAGTACVHIDRDRNGYEVELSNGLELKFNRSFQLIGHDD